MSWEWLAPNPLGSPPDPTTGELIDDLQTDLLGLAVNASAYANVQDAVDTGLLLGAEVVFPPGTYARTTTLTLYSKSSLRLLSGAVLDFTGLANAGTMISVAGSEAATVNLSANTTAGATSVSVAAGAEAGFAAGDFVRIGDTTAYDPGQTDSYSGEICEVLSTASGSITLRSPLMGGPYLTAASATISKLTMAEDVKIHGPGKIKGKTGGGQFGFKASKAVNVRVTDVIFDSAELVAVQLLDCLDTTIQGCKFYHCNNATGYGVSFVDGCQGGVVHGCHFRDCRHPTSINNTTTVKSIPRHITVAHCIAWDSIAGADCFDTHSACEHISYLYNRVYDAGLAGFNIECPSATIIGNEIVRPAGNGVTLVNKTDKSTDFVVNGNRVVSPGAYGIRFASSSTAGQGSVVRQIQICNNNITGAVDMGIRCESTDTWRVKNAKINGNTVSNCASATGQIYLSKADNCEVNNNHSIDSPNGSACIRFNDVTKSTCADNVAVFTSAGTTRAIRIGACTDVAVTGNVVDKATGVGGIGIEIEATSTWCSVVGNNIRSATAPLTLNTGVGNWAANNVGVTAVTTVASAATITLPGSEGGVYKISGTTTIDTITATGMAGKVICLIFTSTANLGDGTGNLKTAGTIVPTADDGIMLACDGTNWFQLGPIAVN